MNVNAVLRPKKFYVDDEQGVCAFKFVAVTCLAPVMERLAKVLEVFIRFIDAPLSHHVDCAYTGMTT